MCIFPEKYMVYAGNLHNDGMIHCDNIIGVVSARSLKAAHKKAQKLTKTMRYAGHVLRRVN